MSSHFGLELLSVHHQEDVRRKIDGLVLFFHWKLLTNDLRCVGNGEHFGGDQEIIPTELLPSGWSQNGETYTLKYRHAKTQAAKFVLKVVLIDKEDSSSPFEISLVRIADEETRSMSIKPNDVIDDNFTAKDIDALSNEIDEKMLKTLLSKEEKQKSALLVSHHLPHQQQQQQQPELYQPPNRPPQGVGPIYPRNDPFVGIGSSDLDPFGRIGSGGMLADPFQPRGGGGFPGPRFDPPGAGFLPGGRGPGGPRGRGEGRGRNGNRRNYGDDLPPPGYDDMFM